jgi:phosphoribosylamine--glycine ligase
MKVLVVGGGGREHALCDALGRSPSVDQVWCAPGNAGIADVATCVPDLLVSDVDGLADLAEREGIDLTVVGPEAPLVAGLVDRFTERGLVAFGPTKDAARLEGSKAFAKSFMARHNIPTATSVTFTELAAAREHITQRDRYPVVIKADGLAAGKGVVICAGTEAALDALDQMMLERRFGEAGDRVVIEDYLRGEEASIHVITDGKTLYLLPTAQDHKAIGEGDTGPNTGGMGAYSPAPLAEGGMLDRIVSSILVPTLHGLATDEIVFRGCLFVGLMLTKGGPRVLEYNARFGDPETEVILPRLQSDLGEVLLAAATGRLDSVEGPSVDTRTSVGVVMASGGYPGTYAAGKVIQGLDAAAALDGVRVYHAGTRRPTEHVVTAGGRVLCVTALGEGFAAARARAYEAVDRIAFDGAYVRRDIGHRVLA